MVAHVGLISLSASLPSMPCLPRIGFTKRRPFPRLVCLRLNLDVSGPSIGVAALSDDPVQEWILTEGKATQITGIRPVGGGCINLANRYDTDAGSFFVKTNRSIGPSMFEAEAIGLDAMYETRTIRVPKPFKVGPLRNGGSYIIMEYIEFGSSRSNQSVLGRKLAEMHKAGKSDKGFGFPVNNTVGSVDGIEEFKMFYGEHRLGYQIKLAQDQYGDSTIYQRGQRLIKNMAPLFEDIVIEPCLLHGDLWSGNITSDKNGEPMDTMKLNLECHGALALEDLSILLTLSSYLLQKPVLSTFDFNAIAARWFEHYKPTIQTLAKTNDKQEKKVGGFGQEARTWLATNMACHSSCGAKEVH
ncbi:hypothetical protein F383_34508 [Gossypium arboreum]|uniref:protein-ribulosamine 3-kinase n=1 Tax=Gossypium arboreum TaxID=29729 RepID=A0A0B0N3E6_GOSAR|nr:hypothetical protein F383_34508 [Gossypium arboreum]